MNAKEMFEELDYFDKTKNHNGEKVYENMFEQTVIGFNNKQYSVVDMSMNFMGLREPKPKLVDIKLHQAIHQQMIELKWINQ